MLKLNKTHKKFISIALILAMLISSLFIMSVNAVEATEATDENTAAVSIPVFLDIDENGQTMSENTVETTEATDENTAAVSIPVFLDIDENGQTIMAATSCPHNSMTYLISTNPNHPHEQTYLCVLCQGNFTKPNPNLPIAGCIGCCTHPYNMCVNLLTYHIRYSDGSCNFRWGVKCNACGNLSEGSLGFSNWCTH